MSEAIRAATAKAVPELSVSTTVRTAPGATAAGLAVLGAAAAGVPGLGVGAAPAPGRGGLVAAGIATVEEAGLATPGVVGRGGSEIRIVSFLDLPEAWRFQAPLAPEEARRWEQESEARGAWVKKVHLGRRALLEPPASAAEPDAWSLF